MSHITINGKTRKAPRGIYPDRGYICIRIFPNGHEHREQIGPINKDNYDLAVEKLEAYRKQIKAGKFNIELPPERITLAKAWDVWFELHGQKLDSWKTVRSRGIHIKKHLGSKFLDAITYLEAQDYRDTRLKEGAHPTTVNKEHADVAQIYNRFQDWIKIKKVQKVVMPESNPFRTMRGILEKTNERQFTRKRVLTQAEQDILLSVCDARTRRIVLGALNTLLSRKDLELLDLTEHWDKAHNKFTGIRSKTGINYEIPINSVCRWLIQTSPDGKRVFDFTNFTNVWPDIQAAAVKKGVAPFQFKDLRRTGAIMLFEAGVKLGTLRLMLGHADVLMTMAYLNITEDTAREEVESHGSRYAKHLTSTDGNTDVRPFENGTVRVA